MSHGRQSPELAIEWKLPGSVSLLQILPTIAVEVWWSDVIRLQSWHKVYQADLYTPQVQGSINAAYSRWKPKVVTPHSSTLCHMELLIQLFDGSRIPAAVSGFWCRQISSLLRHPIVVTFGIRSSMQWFSDSPGLFSLLFKLHIYIKSFVFNLGSSSFFPCWGGILGTKECHNAFSIITNLESSLKTSINPNSSAHTVILTVKVFPFWQFY